MSFRRKRDKWDEFLKRYGEELRSCGLPDYLLTDKMRFLVFLDHGYDDWGRHQNPHAFFDGNWLTAEQLAKLAEMVSTHVDASYRISIASGWKKSG